MKRGLNVLLILTDQHRLSAVGAYGETPCQTPHIDRLAEEGVRFENARTVTQVCSPARATLMTGLYPHAHGMTKNSHNPGCAVNELPDQPSLLSRRLEAAGYSIGHMGKWHLGRSQTPSRVGFEGPDIPGFGGHDCAAFRAYLTERGFIDGVEVRPATAMVLPWGEQTHRIWPCGEWAGPEASTLPYFVAEHTLDLLRDFGQRDQPFFFWSSFWGPHGAFLVSRSLVDLYREVPIPPWPNYGWPAGQIQGPHRVKLHPLQARLS